MTTPPAPQPAANLPPAEGLEVAPGVRVAEAALRFQFARSSGPGGQNVNKVNTKAEMWVPLDALRGLTERARGRLPGIAGRYLTDAGEIHIASDSERTQQANRAAVMDRLREVLIAALHEPKARRKTTPSRRAKQRRLDSKKRRSDVKANRRGKPEW
jgi:ribosome-associated protein